MTAPQTEPLSLEELLRRCHHEELVPLARKLGMEPARFGRDALSSAVARALRQRGSNDLANALLRGGDGPPWHHVVDQLLGRLQLPAEGSLEERELAVVRQALTAGWDGLVTTEREALWRRMGLELPSPVDGEQAVQRAMTALDRRFDYTVTTALVMGRLPPAVPLAGCLLLAALARPDDRKLIRAVLEVARLRAAVRHRVTVGVVGSPSCGKDAAIRALFGHDSGNVDPVAGSTREVEITRLPGATALYVVNTPGLGDVVEAVSEEARQVLDHIDVYLYLLNAQGGVQAREKGDYDACRATGRPVLAAVNKVDTIRAEERERYLADACKKLEAPSEDFVAVAFDPLPQLSEQPLGVDEVRAWVTEKLVERGKDAAELPWA